MKENTCYVKIEEGILYIGKTLSSNEIWNEFWVDFARVEADNIVFCLKEMKTRDLEMIDSLREMKPRNLVV